MNIDELIVRLQEIRSNRGNVNVDLKEIGSDRYGNTIGLVAGEDAVWRPGQEHCEPRPGRTCLHVQLARTHEQLG